MKSCVGCKYAVWHRTAAGKLHPSGDGACAYVWVAPPLPAAMYFPTHKRDDPSSPIVCGGYINRNTELKSDCACYTKEDKP